MKKIQLTGLALATLAACAPAWAQSTVTIYGAVDMALGRVNYLDSTNIRPGKIGLQSSSAVNLQDSFVGFRGVEDLGGGTQLGFQLEQKLDASSGTADPEGAFARSANLWLGGGWGRLILGRATTPSYNAMASWDLMAAGNNSIANATYGAVGFNTTKRESNQIGYRLPRFGGLTLEMSYIPKDENILAGANRSRFDAGVTYKNEGLTFGVAYNKTSGMDANYALGAKYIYQNFEFSGGYYHSRYGVYSEEKQRLIVVDSDGTLNGLTIGGKVNLGQLSLGLDVARDVKSEYTRLSVPGVRFDGKKYTSAVISGVYSLSKRTSLYANYMRRENFNNYGVGISHSF